MLAFSRRGQIKKYMCARIHMSYYIHIYNLEMLWKNYEFEAFLRYGSDVQTADKNIFFLSVPFGQNIYEMCWLGRLEKAKSET